MIFCQFAVFSAICFFFSIFWACRRLCVFDYGNFVFFSSANNRQMQSFTFLSLFSSPFVLLFPVISMEKYLKLNAYFFPLNVCLLRWALFLAKKKSQFLLF